MLKLLAATISLAATNTLTPAQFAPAAGWHSGTGKARACAGVSAERCTESWAWTSTTRWRDCRSCAPHNTLAVLPRGGVIVTVTRVHETPVVAMRLVKWPPRIAGSDVTAGIEGIPNRYGVYQLFGHLADRDEVMVRIYFGRSHPTSRQLTAANIRLRDTRLP